MAKKKDAFRMAPFRDLFHAQFQQREGNGRLLYMMGAVHSGSHVAVTEMR